MSKSLKVYWLGSLRNGFIYKNGARFTRYANGNSYGEDGKPLFNITVRVYGHEEVEATDLTEAECDDFVLNY